jgi:hypothetical protein
MLNSLVNLCLFSSFVFSNIDIIYIIGLGIYIDYQIGFVWCPGQSCVESGTK